MGLSSTLSEEVPSLDSTSLVRPLSNHSEGGGGDVSEVAEDAVVGKVAEVNCMGKLVAATCMVQEACGCTVLMCPNLCVFVRVLHNLHGGQHDEFQLHLRAVRLDVMGTLAAASAESYQRAYPLLHDLHFLLEAEQGFIFLQKAGETEDFGQRGMLSNKQTP
ncbi:hypothetical protein PsorP6_014549 [Peronosclerospora sorghi]|uniref:Uncharacterized protein n=1 Tax=Peronosclerospora sorghi TaxID=230839 RepID=A0ACC0VU47_9STRA|nr:hypothetical protein PsorP6_014549 [Peronosclerospora sorghi]